MKKPILAIGVLLFIIFLLDLYGRKRSFFQTNFIPSSCKAVMIKLQKSTPGNWSIDCEGNNLAITIDSTINTTSKALRASLYRNLANHMVAIAKNSPQETLERVFIVRLRINHPQLRIDAVTEGKDISKLATLSTPQFVADHLKSTVQVKETPK